MYISLDLETTGIDPSKDRIIEFGAIKFDMKGPTEKKTFLINPGVTLPQIITHITKLTDDDLKGQPSIAEKIDEIKEFIGDLPIIGHNIQFDTSFLKNNGIDLKNSEYDTFNLASILFPNLPSYSLEILSDILDIQHREKHRALDDSIAAMELFIKLINTFQELPSDIIAEIQTFASKSNWKLKDLILSLSPKAENQTLPNKNIDDQKIEPSEKTREIAGLIEKESTALFETIPPYNELALALSEKKSANTYICVNNDLFNEISSSLPAHIAQLDAPKNYLSSKRLEELKQKPFLEEHEATSLTKFLIWSKTTHTGLIHELNLFGAEKTVKYQVNADPELTDIDEEPFVQKAIKKDLESPAICTFEYLTDNNSEKIENLIILEFEKFTKEIFYKNSLHLTANSLLHPLISLKELNPENQTIESLISKATILCGIFGVIFEKYNNRDSYNPRAIIDQSIQSSKEWQDINNSINNLISISQELGEIIGPKTNGYLQKWKRKLTELKTTFDNPDLGKFLIFIEIDYVKNITLHKMPISLKEAIGSVLDNCENYKLVDECFDINDEGRFTKEFYGLPKDLKVIQTSPKNENLKVHIAKPDESEFQLVTNLLRENTGKIAIIFNSKKQIEFFTLKLSNVVKEKDINLISQLTGSIGKLEEKYAKSPEKSVLLITSTVWERFRYNDLVDTLVIQKIPFDAPGNLYLSALTQSFRNAFMEFQIPHAIMNIKKILNRLTAEKGQAYFLDSRLYEKDYCSSILKMLTTH